MKKFVYSVFIAFWSSVLILVVLQAMVPEKSLEPERNPLPVYAPAELAEHDALDDCWMAIEGKVYDFTDYIPEHPASPSVIEPWCGREATEGMQTKGYGANHSRRAWAMMDDYLIGEFSTN